MRYPSILVMVISALALSACGGGGKEFVAAGPADAAAGTDKSVNDTQTVVLDGRGSSNAESFQWTQVSGDTVTLQNADTAQAQFTPPQNCTSSNLVFELEVTDSSGATDTDQITVTLNPVFIPLTINQFELAQTHVLPAAGKTMNTNNKNEAITERSLHATGGRAALALLRLNQTSVSEAKVEGRLNGTDLGSVTLNAPANLPDTESNGDAYADDAFSATLPDSWMHSGLQIRVAGSCRHTPSAWNSQAVIGGDFAMTMRILPFYLFGANEVNTGRPVATTGNPPANLVDEMFAKWPVATLSVSNHPAGKVEWPDLVIPPRSGNAAYVASSLDDYQDGFAGLSTLHGILSSLRRANGESTQAIQYYAPLLAVDDAGSYRGPGGGIGGGGIGTGDDTYSGIFIHEAGHAFGIPHVGDAYDGNRYPYEWGSLNGSVWGFDQINNQFLSVELPATASRFNNCSSQTFAGRARALDSEGNCIKQDPMQSGSGDQGQGYQYATFSDYSTGIKQRWFEGETSVNGDGSHSANSQIVPDSSFPGGYKRWDTIDREWVNETDETTQGGIFGLNKRLPQQTDVLVYSIVATISNVGAAGATQIYPPVRYRGNLLDVIDPTTQAGRDRIQPNTSELFWYCRNGGCDYTLRVEYADSSTRNVLLQGGFRPFNQPSGDAPASASDPTDGDSFERFAVNVPDLGEITSIQLLHTPKVWEGFPVSPAVLATR